MSTKTASRKAHLISACALVLGAFASTGQAATTDLSSQPLATMPTVKAKPNLLFVLDDSGSMAWSWMPDNLGYYDEDDQIYLPRSTWRGYWSSQCNGVAYDPTQNYPPPLYADGTSYPNASFTNAKNDGFLATSGTTNLSARFYYNYTGTQPKMGWTYTTSGVVNNTFYQECSSSTSSLFTLVLTSTLSTADQQKYANWYSYYSKRYLLMRTAMGRAISALDSGYRVGFTTIHDTNAVDGQTSVSNDLGYFRDVKDFDATQKTRFYASLYKSTPDGGTPLRPALSKAGRYFASKAPGQTYDPVQYSCQRNYTLLSTDGYWNGAKGVQLDGSTVVGQQDGTENRPMRDDTKSILTTVTRFSAAASRTQFSSQTRNLVWSRTATTVSQTRGQSGCSNSQYRVRTQAQTYTQRTQTQTFATPQAATAWYDRTVVTTDGVVTSGPTDSAVSYSAWSNAGAATTTTSNGPDGGAPTSSSYSNSGSVVTTCQSTAGTGNTTYTTPSAGSWTAWSALTTTTSSPTVGAYDNGVATMTPSTSGGTADTLADGAGYFYKTDLRTTALGNCTSTSSGTTQNVCSNIVPTLGSDTANWQHMNTYTIGLGVSGTLPYDRNYLTQTAGSYVNLSNGSADWPAPGNAQNSSVSEDARNVDDLWHAAVNGRGQYYSAQNASALTEAINGVVTAVQAVSGSASAASTSALQLVSGTSNRVFGALYTTGAWTGDLQAFPLNGEDATIGSTKLWSAQELLDAVSPSARKIYLNNGGTLQNFDYANLSSTQKNYFDNLCSKPVVGSQCAALSTADKALANSGSKLVDWLRGVRTHESVSGSTAALYRKREHMLGDIVNGAPIYVGKPPYGYSDSGYSVFASSKASRTPVVYVAANDGMLHAFSADTGAELWAFVPSMVMQNLYKLADNSYASKHQYFVDGAPEVADIKIGSTWKTILVGGLGGGGASYYALDVTDPANPQAMWEFTDANMGMTYGNPIVTKRADGTWVVAVTSGYNNTSGDGSGHLYLVNANTGAKLLDISTGAGSAGSPSGLTKINAWVDSAADNTAKRFYGGDMQGNVWRFDIDNLVQPHQAALRLAKLQLSGTAPQPITTKPQLAENAGQPVVLVATGRYLGQTDIEDSTQQTVYAIKDPLTNTSWGDVRANSTNFVTQTFTLNHDTAGKPISAAVSDNAVNWATKAGWRVDLPQSGERVNTEMALQFGTLAFATTIPTGNACDSGGGSWIYNLDANNGGVIASNPSGVLFNTNSVVVGLSWAQTSSGNSKIIVQGGDGTRTTTTPQVDPSGGGAGGAHRTSWRELVD